MSNHNSKIPICILPAEILAAIFKYCLPLPAPRARKVLLRSRSQTLAWLTLTRVCQYWRTVALNHPWMWTFPDFSFPKFAREMLKRSKSAPLDIHYFESYSMKPRSPKVLLEALDNTSRLASVHLNMNQDLDKAVAKLVQPAPLLHSLIVISCQQLSVPAGFLGGDAPHLTSMELHRCYLPWNSSLLNSLTILSLKGDGRSNRPEPRHFTDALHRMTALEVLELDNIFPVAKAETPAVLLPKLRSLVLVARNQPECGYTLSYLSIPAATKIHISCRMSVAYYQFTPLLNNISSLFAPNPNLLADTRVIRTLVVQGDIHDNLDRLRLKSWSTDDIPLTATHDINDSPVPDLFLELKWGTGAQFPVIAKSFLFALPFPSLQTLHIHLWRADFSTNGYWYQPRSIDMERLEVDLWPDTLKILVIRGEHGLEQLSLVLGRWGVMGSHAPKGSYVMGFPSLECLVVFAVNFNKVEGGMASLNAALGSRVGSETVIQKVVLKQCWGYSDEDLEQMKRRVNVVEKQGS
ncbi:hypothetical protein VNI00_004606 [Paramarasmius palmivorus]|uniref:F-box domain-containing protein n=1 Tax=Paramarasmius palmivorus TaxID=297713 RepID=A0AAW0DJ38_9AGAR